MPVRVLIADDHRMFREGLTALLPLAEFEVVAQAADGREAVRLARRHAPDLALLDVSMPGLNGVDATREVLRVSPRSRVIILTMHRDSAYLFEALRAGARGYVLKSQGRAELLDALRAVARGEAHLAEGLIDPLVGSFRSGTEGVTDPLSPREREVLQLIAEGRSAKEIGALLDISPKTAESHRARIMAKLDVHETAGLVRYAIRRRLIEA